MARNVASNRIEHGERPGHGQADEAERHDDRQNRQRHGHAEALHQVAGHDELQHERRDLRDQVDLREDGGPHVGVVAERRDHLQAREVDERRDHRHQQHVGRDAEQVAATGTRR